MSALITNTVANDKGESLDFMQNRIESLSSKMDKLIHIQEKVLYRLDGMSHDIDDIEKDMENLKVDKEEIHLPPRVMNQTQVMGREVKKICQEMSTIMSAVNQRSEQQAQKLEGMEKLVLSMQQVIGFIGETVKSSKIMELILKGPTSRKVSKPKDNKGKQAIKRKSSADTIAKKQDKKTTSNKTSKGNQQITSACEPSAPQPSHKIKLHGPKHFLASRKCGYFMKDHKSSDGAEKPCLSPKSQTAQKRMKPPDTTDNISLKKQVLLRQEVQKLNFENSEKTAHQLTPGSLDVEAAVPPTDQQLDSSACKLEDHQYEDSQAVEKNHEVVKASIKEEAQTTILEGEPVVAEQEPKLDKEDAEKEKEEEKLKVPEKTKEEEAPAAEEVAKPPEIPAPLDTKKNTKEPTPARPDASPAEQDQVEESSSTTAKSFVTEEHFVVEEYTAGHEKVKETKEDEEENDPKLESAGLAVFKLDEVEYQFNLEQKLEMDAKENDAEKEEDGNVERYFIDTAPPLGAPFNHRIVSAKPNQISNFYTISWQDILGGGRFGQVHKCVENSSGLTFAAKVIKVRSQKEKEMVKNEIQVMNNLDHANLIQLYAAYESRNDIILVLEYVSGGELFDRIIDENYTLMELDAVMFIRQICEGLQHMHKMYILHLDLKPENILCVSRVTNKIKIIDFGLARIYKPREKLRVNFGTPEFLAPEVINYDFASFNTDMWSLGVITYMLLSGLSPFLGDDDNETLNNILACQWNFEEQEFRDTSEEAKDFISRLLIINKSWRMSASEALRHPWLSSTGLHHRLHSKKTMCRSRQSSCVLVPNS
ncbi:myosin light chain kinase 3-like isoform X1 [Solea senegalensis]|uniref:Myosin light chain kinase 3-like isoform X1 n=1 Tax=Solea senegalensis TaxID=28829 RepID=A0AAV6T931_SOLSE|nr:myosin light chain kinase 2, skeletal/cardiac muscle isoform X1 [Solea senegalensis]KAG7525678.1 myosin light chain kinase 3-like isoform X1 [Solea senegalensis]